MSTNMNSSSYWCEITDDHETFGSLRYFLREINSMAQIVALGMKILGWYFFFRKLLWPKIFEFSDLIAKIFKWFLKAAG